MHMCYAWWCPTGFWNYCLLIIHWTGPSAGSDPQVRCFFCLFKILLYEEFVLQRLSLSAQCLCGRLSVEIRCSQVESGMMSSSCVRVGPDPLLLSFHSRQMWMWKEEDSDGTGRGWEVAAAKQQPKMQQVPETRKSPWRTLRWSLQIEQGAAGLWHQALPSRTVSNLPLKPGRWQ